MAFLDHNGESEFPMNKNQVFDAMCIAIPTIKGMKVETADKLQGRIMVKAGVSLYSWGENIPIQLLEVGDNKTKVQITSSPKTGMMFGGAFDMGKNRKNIENILSATSTILQQGINQQPSLQNQTTTTSNQQTTTNFQSTLNSNYMTQETTNSNAWYNKTWLVVLLCIIFFPVGLYALWKNQSISKGWKIGVTALIAIIVIANLGSKDSKTSSTSSSATSETATSSEPKKEKQWTTVYTFKGNGMKKSPVFELTGGDAKIKYSYKAPGGIGMGMFSVYVVDEGDDIMKTGGIPEVMTQAENEDSESALQKGSGRYYLNVNASGSWVVTVEELK